MSDKSENYNLKQYFYNVVSEPLDKFNMFTTWGKEETEEFRALLDELKRPYDKDTETIIRKRRLNTMMNIMEDREYFFKAFMEKMMIAERMVEEQGYYSEEEVEEELSLI